MVNAGSAIIAVTRATTDAINVRTMQIPMRLATTLTAITFIKNQKKTKPTKTRHAPVAAETVIAATATALTTHAKKTTITLANSP